MAYGWCLPDDLLRQAGLLSIECHRHNQFGLAPVSANQWRRPNCEREPEPNLTVREEAPVALQRERAPGPGPKPKIVWWMVCPEAKRPAERRFEFSSQREGLILDQDLSE